MTSKRLTIAIYGADEFVDASTIEAIRLANVAFETAAAREAKSTDAKACAWQFIRYYYAAYFAANSLMRLCGHASTNLLATDCTAINEQAALYGVGGTLDKNKFVPGVYYARFDQATTPRLTLRLSTARGGVHAQFWSGFQEFLSTLNQDISRRAAPPVEKTIALGELAALTAELQRAGASNGTWLSEMRNAVNYRFEHGLWYPYEDSVVDSAGLLDSFKRAVAGSTSVVNIAAATSDPVRAARTSAFLLSWLRSSMVIIGGVARGKKKALIENGALAFAARV